MSGVGEEWAAAEALTAEAARLLVRPDPRRSRPAEQQVEVYHDMAAGPRAGVSLAGCFAVGPARSMFRPAEKLAGKLLQGLRLVPAVSVRAMFHAERRPK